MIKEQQEKNSKTLKHAIDKTHTLCYSNICYTCVTLTHKTNISVLNTTLSYTKLNEINQLHE